MAKGLYEWLKFFSSDTNQLSRAFEHVFILDKFYVATLEGKVVGIAGCTNGITPCMKLNYKELCKHLGVIKGVIATIILKKEFENHSYPFQIDADCGSIEFVATHENYQGQGIALSITNEI